MDVYVASATNVLLATFSLLVLSPNANVYMMQKKSHCCHRCNTNIHSDSKFVRVLVYCTGNQGCWRNEGSMNRGMDRGRGLGIDVPFFVIHVRTSKLKRPFKFRTNSGSNSPSSFPKQDFCGSWTLWAHVLNIW